jgi:hypothetical protein
MPMVPVDIDSSTVVVTSVISAVITFAFCAAMDLRPGISLAVAAAVGIALFTFGVVPIGLIAAIGIAMVIAFLKKVFGGDSSQ